MDVDRGPTSRRPIPAVPVALVVAAVCLATVATALAAAGGIGLDDASAPLSAIQDAGRLTSSRVLVCSVAAVGLAAIGVRGVPDGSTAAVARRLQFLGIALTVLSSWNGLWLTAALTSVFVIGAVVGARVARGRQHAASNQAS